MSKSMKPTVKPAGNARPLTDEEKRIQVERFFAQKRESYFQLILGNAIRTGANTNLKEVVDASLAAADYAIEKLFPLPTEEKKEGE